MKIVVNAYSARVGGGQTYLINLLREFPDHPDLQVLIFAPEGLSLPEHPQVSRVHTRWPTVNPWLRAIWERFVLPRFLRRVGASVLFCPGGVVGTRPPAGCKIATMFRNMIPFDAEAINRVPWGLQRFRILIQRTVFLRSMSSADLTIFISEYARTIIEGLTVIPNAVTIPHGIAPIFRSYGTALARPPKAPRGDFLLYVSRLDTYKHHREVVLAFAALPEALRLGLQLVFLGETNLPESGAVSTLVRQTGMHEHILLLGALPYSELPAWYQHARATIFASSCENCPNILLEALGAGKPVLCSNIMPMPEFGGPGLVYFEPNSPESIRLALESILTNSERAGLVAAAALERSKQYDWRNTAASTWMHLTMLGRPKPERISR